jgi:hypothetical protein
VVPAAAISSAVTSANDPSTAVQVSSTTTCAVGKLLISGGAYITATSGEIDDVVLTASYPSSTAAWTAIGTVISSGFSGSENFTVTTYAICTT